MFKLLVGMLGLAGCVAAVAFASADNPKRTGRPVSAHGPRPGRPRITLHPARATVSTAASFRFRLRHARAFACSLDGQPASRCRSPLRLHGLDPGAHRFSVRALDRAGRRGRAAHFRWRVVAAQPFEVRTHLEGLRSLYPGAPPIVLPLTVENPNREAIEVVGLGVSVTQSPPGCDAGENLFVAPSSASPSSPLRVSPGGSAELPQADVSAPSIQLRDLPRNQDACQGGRFELRFEGTAHG